jgi:leucyl/phenylalanyl-tRNA--protein transferase
MFFQLTNELVFPDPKLSEEDGLLAIGGDLSIERLLLAYTYGIFPWFNPDEPILWWSPKERPLFFPGQFKLSKSMKSTIRNKGYEVKFDQNFEAVLDACASTPRKEGNATWLGDDMKASYRQLHRLGYAHSVETYLNDELVGGLYGVSLGRAFFGESMFAKKSDASKVALFTLLENMKDWGFAFVDGQIPTDHMKSIGAQVIQQDDFMEILDYALSFPDKTGKWTNGIADIKSRV